mmetsp:Transcript_9990/g.32054  ORF Transcript_9990/g.32054 Transcript_9990/m.32054 type:complete len:202 (-) Transcript_9990:370-975(-)
MPNATLPSRPSAAPSWPYRRRFLRRRNYCHAHLLSPRAMLRAWAFISTSQRPVGPWPCFPTIGQCSMFSSRSTRSYSRSCWRSHSHGCTRTCSCPAASRTSTTQTTSCGPTRAPRCMGRSCRSSPCSARRTRDSPSSCRGSPAVTPSARRRRCRTHAQTLPSSRTRSSCSRARASPAASSRHRAGPRRRTARTACTSCSAG